MQNTEVYHPAMGIAINVVAVILACIATASAVPTQFPHGKTIVYKYYGDVKAGIIEPGSYASQFALEGLLYVKHETSDPTLKNAYYVSLTNVRTGMHNGMAMHYQTTKVLTPITEAAKVIEKPFLIVYDENSRLEGVKITATEPGWSKNMKMAMASMLQLDLANMKIDAPLKPQSFISKENTIHGDCWVDYDVHVQNQFHPDPNKFVVTKFSSPKNCTGFEIRSFNHVDKESCQAKEEEPVNVASRRVFEIEKQGNGIIIKKLVAHGGSNYFPRNARSEAHYVLNNATFAFEAIVPVAETNLPRVNFRNMPMIRNLSYQKPRSNYAPNAATDVTQGRRVVDQTSLVRKVKEMLGEAADYIEENHLEMKEPDWIRGQTLNRILYTMSYMEVGSLEQVFNAYKDLNTPRAVTIKNILLGMIPQIGTSAGCLFTLNSIRNKIISNDMTAIEMLAKLPLNVKVPNEELLLQMEGLVKFSDSVSVEVRKAAILCFSSMIYRTMKDLPRPEENKLLGRYLQYFFENVKTATTYEMKVSYLMALRNVQVGKIHELLAPIIRGDLKISEDPVHARLLAIWAIEKSIEQDYHYAHDLLWPVMADLSLPVKLRIAAYEILIHQAPSMTDVLHIYWFMVYEKNEHLYNYHHTTIKGIANSVDPCNLHLRELVRKIMRFTRVHETIRYTLASAYSIDYKDEKYNFADKLRTGVIVNEVTGVPEVLQFEHTITDSRKPFSNIAVRLHVQGFDEIFTLLKNGQFKLPGNLADTNVLGILKRVAQDLPPTKKIHVDAILMYKGRVIVANHYNEKTLKKIYDDVWGYIDQYKNQLKNQLNLNSQHILYDNLYEKQVTSEMGLPVVFENRVPVLTSLKINYNSAPGSNPMTMNFEVEAKLWRHGDYSISTYNPLADVWHAIRRSTATDVTLPIRMTIAYNRETHSLKITLPRLPVTKFSTIGVLTHAKDCVTVNEDDTEKLKRSCPTCDSYIDVSRGVQEKKQYERHVDVKDTGLKYSMAIFDCESGVTPVTATAEMYRAFMSERKNTWNNWLVHGLLATRQLMKNALISPAMGNCGALLKIEPSNVYPTSRVDISVHGSVEDVDHKSLTFHVFGSKKYNVHGTMDLIGASDVSARSWDANVNIDVNQGHLTNMAKIHLTRKTPGQKNLKICLDAQKSYSVVPNDPLKLGSTAEETNSKLTVAAGYTNGKECVLDNTLVTMTVKGALSNEQKTKYTREKDQGQCNADIKNPLYANPKNIIPKTLNCLKDAISYTTLRKYTINVLPKKVTPELTSRIMQLEDILRSYLLPNLEYTMDHTEPGNITIDVEYPLSNDVVDLSVMEPDRSYNLLDVNFEKPRFNGFGPVIRPLWYFPLDNTRFSISSLYKFTHDALKLCSVYPKVVLTGDGKNIPFSMTNQWTLVSGDHVNKHFAIFAKTAGNNLAVKIFAASHIVEILPNTNNNIQVNVDGQPVRRLENGVLVPADSNSWILKVTKLHEQIIVQMKDDPIMIVHGINHVALAIENELEGKIGGLCGHLNGSQDNEKSNSYTL